MSAHMLTCRCDGDRAGQGARGGRIRMLRAVQYCWGADLSHPIQESVALFGSGAWPHTVLQVKASLVRNTSCVAVRPGKCNSA